MAATAVVVAAVAFGGFRLYEAVGPHQLVIVTSRTVASTFGTNLQNEAGQPVGLPPTVTTSGAPPGAFSAHSPVGSAAQIDTLLGFIQPTRTSGDIFLPITDLSPHQQPMFATGSKGPRAGYRVDFEVDVGAERWVTMGVEYKELTDAYLSLKVGNRLTPTDISFEGNEWQQGANPDGTVIVGVEIPATGSAHPYVLTIRMKTVDTALGLAVAKSMKRFANPGMWQDLQDQLASSTIQKAEIWADGPKRAVLTGADAQEFSDAFVLGGIFSEDNPDSYGPTASVVVTLTYAGGQVITLPQWPDGRFQVQIEGRQFLVSSPNSASLLRDRGFVYQ
ncbi:MAG: hypothetical protein M1337_01855 [Actinobacteria bacterium]|nr:hypothetical protein [Actinomycetota bacterium]